MAKASIVTSQNIIADTEDSYELTPLQEGMLFYSLRDTDAAMYFQQAVFTMARLDAAAFEKAWQRIVDRHPIFRTSFHWIGREKPIQVVHRRVTLPVEHLDWRAFPPFQQEAQLTQFLTADRKRGLPLSDAPLIRIALIRISEDAYYYVWTHHHILLDGWSGPLILKELFQLYGAFRRGSDIDLPLPRPFRDYITWLRQQDMGQAEAFWRRYLEGFKVPTLLPEDRTADGRRILGDRFEVVQAHLSQQATSSLNHYVRSQRITLNTVVQGAWALLLSRYSGSEEVCFGTLVSGRPSEMEGIEHMIGLFINTLPVRVRVREDEPLSAWLKRLHAEQAEARRYEYSPLVKVRDWSEVGRGQPLFESLVVLESYTANMNPDRAARAPRGRGGDLLKRTRTHVERTNYPLAVAVSPDNGLLLRITYDRLRFAPNAVTRIFYQLKTLLESIVANSERPLWHLGTLPDHERQRVLVDWNNTGTDFDLARCAHTLIEERVQAAPQAVALSFANESISYAELDRRANQLAHHLRTLGAGPERPVAMCLERGPDTIIGLLAILKAGGVYLPLDPAYPCERLAYMVGDARPCLVVTQLALREHLPQDLPAVCVDDPEHRRVIAAQPDTPPASMVTPNNAAYIIYTSGSTGQPKGVLVEHRNLVNLVLAQIPVFGVGPDTRVLQMISLCFDASLGEIFRALASGATLCLARQQDLLPGPGLMRLLREQCISVVAMTPSLLASLPEEPLPDLRTLIIGGEACPPELTARWGRERHLINAYGPTETTICATAAVHWDVQGKPPLGRPLANVRAYVLDSHMRPVPVGFPGELFLGGAGVARGYLNRPELTAERFIPDPFADSGSGARLYRTGDRVRWLPDGQLEFIGRVDEQVKVRGYRIELGELEAVLAQHPKVRACAADVRGDSTNARLIGYIVPHDKAELPAAELRDFIRARLPEYMVPSAFVALDALPLTSNGKVDRHALPDPSSTQGGIDCVAPRNPVEEMIAAVFAQVLGLDRIGIHDHFQDMGGHSLDATRIVSRLSSALDLELSPGAIFEHQTVAELTGHIEQLRGEASGLRPPPLIPVARDRDLPLSFAQQRLWFLEQLDPGNTFYNMPSLIWLPGMLDLSALETALSELVKRHETLRTTFASRGDEPIQVIHQPLPIRLELVDLSGLAEGDRQRKMQFLREEEMRVPFDLAKGPIFRARAIKLGTYKHALLLCLHHILCDGWSIDIFRRELAMLYRALRESQPSPLEKLPLQYADFAVWQRNWLQGVVLEKHLEYWRTQLSGAPTLELPLDRPRPAVQRHHGSLITFQLEARVADKLRAISRQEGTTLFISTLAVFKLLLRCYCLQDDITVGTPIANRNRSELEPIIGFFANMLALRTQLSRDCTFREILRRVRSTCVGAYDHQVLPFEKLVEELQPVRDLSRSPLFQIVFGFQALGGSVRGAGTGDKVSGIEVAARFDLTLNLTETPGIFEGILQFNTDLFDASTIERMAKNFTTLMDVVTELPDTPIDEMDFLEAEERDRVLRQWNGTATQGAQELIHQLFEEQADRVPERVAISCVGCSLTYSQLEQRANRLANQLIALGVDVGEPVGLLVDRSPDMLVGLLGILKAGAAYVPLDPHFPRERINYMLEDSGLQVLVCEQALIDGLPLANIRTLCLDRDQQQVQQSDLERPTRCVKPESLAYVIYTSGSTGKPKGVMIEHRAVVNFLRSMQERPGLEEHDVLLAVTTLSFDIAVLELILPLSVGARVELALREVAVDGERLLALINEAGVTVMQATPATWRLLIEAGWKGSNNLKVLCGGESLPHDLVEKLLPRVAAVWNMYGPTETTIWSTVHQITHSDGPIPIGRPIANTQVYVLDAHLRPVPIGVPGELYIGGSGLARGYLHRPEMTAERFIPDPFLSIPGARMYRTGDLARWLPTGELECLGRVDQQVKIRGFRIELGEIETALARHPGVRQCVLAAQPDPVGGKRLVAYIIPAVEPLPTLAELRGFLAGTLPEYMLPSVLMCLDALPLTANNKVDRRSLPIPASGGTDTRETKVAPMSPTEEVIARIWGEVLHVREIGHHDNFFDLGGHSLLATKVISRLRAALQIDVPLRLIFEASSLVALAARIDELIGQRANNPIPPLVPVPRDGELPLSFSQQRLWFLAQLAEGSSLYNTMTSVPLRGALDLGAVERALAELVRRHESLRTTFDAREGEPFQIVGSPMLTHLSVVDLRGLSAPRRKSELQQLKQEYHAQPFDLRGSLVRFKLVLMDEQWQLLLVGMHHIITDGWSMTILRREVQALYEAFRAGRPSPLPDLVIQYADFAAWQRGWLQGEMLEQLLSYWKTKLAGATRLQLTTDRPRPEIPRYVSARQPLRIEPALTQKLRDLSRQEEATLFMTLLAAFQVVLGRYSGQDDVSVGTVVANRNRPELEDLIGFFVNTLVMRTSLSGNPSFRELLRRVRQGCLEAYAHQDLPFEKLVEELAPKRDLSAQPLFQVLFVLQNMQVEARESAGRRLDAAPPISPDMPGVIYYDLTLSLTEAASDLSGALHYNTDLFEPHTAECLVQHLQTILIAVADDPDQALSDVSMLSEQERTQILHEWNASTAPPPDCCIHQLVEAQVDRAPNHCALVFEGGELSYGELDRRANQLAHRLCALGVRPEVTVGMYLERGLEAIIALLGILKAGGVYLPLDPGLPPERLVLLLDDARPAVLLTQKAFHASLPECQASILCLDDPTADLQHELDNRPVIEVTPRNLAYIVFTSGSTGRPKGVMIEHRSLTHTISAQVPLFGLTPDSRVLQTIALSFDASLGEIFRTLVAGATLCLAKREDVLPGPNLVRLLREKRITTVTLVSSVLAALPAGEELPELRTLTVGGEALSGEVAARWSNGRRLINGYGPTEATIGATVACGWELGRKPPLGRPLPNVRTYVLDAKMQLLPVGVPGELYLGGPGLARGYLNRPDLTTACFLPDPFITEPGARLYRTGDRVRWLPDGQLEFLGRIDEQVKVRGYRIELEEIATVLRGHAAVHDAVVLTSQNRSGDHRLVAYVVPVHKGGGVTKSSDDLVAEWRQVREAAAAKMDAAEITDPRLNFTGWISSYSGRPISSEEMRCWADSTVERIRQLHPHRVLEIGCGTGLILFRLAPHCQHYVGVDFSAGLLEHCRRDLYLLDGTGCQVELRQWRTDELDDWSDGSFDCVVLNSVVQYFPDVDYLLRVLHTSVRLVRAGGKVFIADVRNLRLLKAFHASVQLSRAAATLPSGSLAQRVQRHYSLERELVLDPGLFVQLVRSWPRLSHVRVLLKAGTAHNELTKFRYDVVLCIEDRPSVEPGCNWLTWQWDSPAEGLRSLRDALAQGPAQLGLRGVPNARTEADAQLLSWLECRPELRTVAELRQELTRVKRGVEPETLTALGQELGYSVELDWLTCDAEGCYDVLFCREGEQMTAAFPTVESESASRRWQEYANNPSQEAKGNNLVMELRDYLVGQLPEYMVPSAFVLLEALPLTTNGKLDRQALPVPEDEDVRPNMGSGYVAPRTAEEKILADIWAALLRLERVGIHDNFFELGGDSILGVRLIARANEAGQKLTIQDLYRFQTIAEQAAVAGNVEKVAAEQGQVTGDVPLTPIEQWFFEGDHPEPHHFNWATFLPMPSGLSADELRQVLKIFLEHHDALRLRFARSESGVWKQVLGEIDDKNLPLAVVDLSGVPAQEWHETIEAKATELQTSLNLAEGPLLRLAWFDLGQGQASQSLLIVHHLVIDAISWMLLREDLTTLLRQARRRQPMQLPPKTSSFKQWAEHLLQHARSGVSESERRYWLDERRFEVACLPRDYPKGLNSRASGQEVTIVMNEQETQGLQRLARATQSGIDEVLLAALGLVLARWTGSWKVLINVERHGREEFGADLNLSRTVGWFANIAPALLEIPRAAVSSEVLHAVQEQLRAIPNRGIGYGLLRYLSDEEVKCQLREQPQAEIFFNYFGQQRERGGHKTQGPKRPGMGPLVSREGLRRHLIEINAMIRQDQLQMRWSYSANLHKQTTIEGLGEACVQVLCEMAFAAGAHQADGTARADFSRADLS